MESLNIARSLLPERLSKALQAWPRAEEIRLRQNQRPTVVTGGRESALSEEALDEAALRRVLEKASGASLHAVAASLKNGFLSYRGLRIGVCGEAVYEGTELKLLRNISSLAIRIPHALPPELDTMIEGMLRPLLCSTLIVAPPGVGKTSFLRALIRHAAKLCRVSVIDERNELSASMAGRAQFDLGRGSDVMVGVSKKQAAMMLLRGMNPQIIAMDEITTREDLGVVEEITGCGVTLFATAHGRDLADMKKRPVYKELLESSCFQELVLISCKGGKRVYTREALR